MKKRHKLVSWVLLILLSTSLYFNGYMFKKSREVYIYDISTIMSNGEFKIGDLKLVSIGNTVYIASTPYVKILNPSITYIEGINLNILYNSKRLVNIAMGHMPLKGNGFLNNERDIVPLHIENIVRDITLSPENTMSIDIKYQINGLVKSDKQEIKLREYLIKEKSSRN